PIALSATPAPGAGSANFQNLGVFLVTDLALADNNATVILANLQHDANVGDSNDSGLWSTRTLQGGVGPLRLVVREGDDVPSSAGPDFTGLRFGSIVNFWVNASGRVAFLANHNDFTRALWIEQADGSLHPVAKEFALFDVHADGSDRRLVSQIVTP